ncbi:MAG: hypothetical protein WD037_14110 [Balneolales bacterium]
MTDITTLLANPALISFQRPRFGTGVKAHHLGLITNSGSALTQGYATISTPDLWKSLGAGFNMQHFNSPIYRQSNFSIAASARLFRYVAIGGQLTAFNISYNRDNFRLDETDDPVFRQGYGKTTMNSSIGLFTQPTEYLGFSLGVRNLNEPNISLKGDDVKEPRTFYAGFSFVQGAFRSLFEIIKEKQDLEGMIFLEAFSGTGDYVRAGSNHHLDKIITEGQLRIAGPLSVNYQYTLPLSSMLGPSLGSHMFSLIYDFGGSPKLPRKVSPPRSRVTFEKPNLSANVESRVFLSSRTDTLTVYEKKITREVDDGVSDQALANVSMYDLGAMDSSFVTEDQNYPAEQVMLSSNDQEFRELLSAEYNRFIQSIGQDTGEDISLISDTTQLKRAMGIRNRILDESRATGDAINIETPSFDSARDSLMYNTPVRRDQIISSEEITILDPEELEFQLNTTSQAVPARNWELTIKNQDVVVKTIAGTGNIPAVVKWDWLDHSGNVIQPGIYVCRIHWQREDGSLRLSNQYALYVQKIQRNITILVTGDQNKMPDDYDQIRLLIKQKEREQ